LASGIAEPSTILVSRTGSVPRWRLWLALGSVYVFWGSGYLGIRVMVRDIPPMVGGGVRFILSGAILLAWFALRTQRASALRIDRAQLGGSFVLGMLLCAASGGFLGLGERHVTSSLAALLAASVPLWVIVLRAAARERTSTLGLVGAAIGFGGVGLLMLPGGGSGETSLVGAALILTGALSWAVGSWIEPRLALPSDVILTTAYQMLLGGAGLTIIGIAAGETANLSAPSGDSVLAFSYLVLVTGLLGYTAYIWLLRNAPLEKTATFAYVNPVVAVALGWALLDETVTPATLVACAVIVGSVTMTLREERAALTPPPSTPPPR
jgi:drug/metabolite transporter (DMT)-like permease